jgi:hypothetical protein
MPDPVGAPNTKIETIARILLEADLWVRMRTYEIQLPPDAAYDLALDIMAALRSSGSAAQNDTVRKADVLAMADKIAQRQPEGSRARVVLSSVRPFFEREFESGSAAQNVYDDMAERFKAGTPSQTHYKDARPRSPQDEGTSCVNCGSTNAVTRTPDSRRWCSLCGYWADEHKSSGSAAQNREDPGCPKCGKASASPPAEVFCVDCATEGWEADAAAHLAARSPQDEDHEETKP